MHSFVPQFIVFYNAATYPSSIPYGPQLDPVGPSWTPVGPNWGLVGNAAWVFPFTMHITKCFLYYCFIFVHGLCIRTDVISWVLHLCSGCEH